MPQPSISTGFPALDQLLGENTDYFGIPRGGLTILTGQVASGKSLLLRKIAEHAAVSGYHVAFIDPEARGPLNPSPPFDYISILHDVGSAHEFIKTHLNRYDLVVIDHYNAFEMPNPTGALAFQARMATRFFHRSWGVTAAIASWQSRRELSPSFTPSMPIGVAYESSLTLDITNEVAAHTIQITKNRYGQSGVGCSVYLDRDSSKPKPVKEVYIPTRFERVLRGDRR